MLCYWHFTVGFSFNFMIFVMPAKCLMKFSTELRHSFGFSFFVFPCWSQLMFWSWIFCRLVFKPSFLFGFFISWFVGCPYVEMAKHSFATWYTSNLCNLDLGMWGDYSGSTWQTQHNVATLYLLDIMEGKYLIKMMAVCLIIFSILVKKYNSLNKNLIIWVVYVI